MGREWRERASTKSLHEGEGWWSIGEGRVGEGLESRLVVRRGWVERQTSDVGLSVL